MATRKPRVTDWRLVVQSRLDRVRADLAALGPPDPLDPESQQWRAVAEQAAAVVEEMITHDEPRWRAIASWWSGWHIERAWRALHEAEIAVVAAGSGFLGRLPGLRARVAEQLDAEDPRRRALEELRPGEYPLSVERELVVDALRAAFDQSDFAHAGSRALRNKLIAASVVLFVVNTVLGVVGLVRPGLVPMCVGSERLPTVCPSGRAPSGADVWLIQVLGAFGAVLSAVVLLLRRRPSLSPYIMIGYQAAIKVLLGAALAVVGILALGAGVTTGLIGVASQAALLLWAVILGYSQQVATRLLDSYADRVLDQARPLPR
ncbi:hypothetical protein [Saccharothrix coeruleofusca]|uniref:Uncharacterized protein n=1 Tax=Saccharothrix coeruleofusca TaxID=33919 RepID=A0A918EDW0_9PSEU|nr:hypothetical protein [Saccharothrix coeruleofusca]MBP2340941.1 hypothetical protein [Saccharothrix coeruleofusca]GGP60964.1 hypothetical protein GCM10010185_36820 [Saccharothrix coeruleofusca]